MAPPPADLRSAPRATSRCWVRAGLHGASAAAPQQPQQQYVAHACRRSRRPRLLRPIGSDVRPGAGAIRRAEAASAAPESSRSGGSTRRGGQRGERRRKWRRSRARTRPSAARALARVALSLDARDAHRGGGEERRAHHAGWPARSTGRVASSPSASARGRRRRHAADGPAAETILRGGALRDWRRARRVSRACGEGSSDAKNRRSAKAGRRRSASGGGGGAARDRGADAEARAVPGATRWRHLPEHVRRRGSTTQAREGGGDDSERRTSRVEWQPSKQQITRGQPTANWSPSIMATFAPMPSRSVARMTTTPSCL